MIGQRILCRKSRGSCWCEEKSTPRLILLGKCELWVHFELEENVFKAAVLIFYYDCSLFLLGENSRLILSLSEQIPLPLQKVKQQ